MSTNYESHLGNANKREHSIINRINRIAVISTGVAAAGTVIGLVIYIIVGSAEGIAFPGMGAIAGLIIGGGLGAIPLPRHKQRPPRSV
jgi:hypothetical protein